MALVDTTLLRCKEPINSSRLSNIGSPRTRESDLFQSFNENVKKRRRILHQIRLLEDTIDHVIQEKHPDLLDVLEEAREQRDSLIKSAEVDLKLLEQNTNTIYQYECQEAENKFQIQRETLKREMLDETETEIKRLRELRNGSNERKRKAKERISTRKTRSSYAKNIDIEKPVVPTVPKTSRKRNNNVFQPLQRLVAESEAEADLLEMQRGYSVLSKYAESSDIQSGVHVNRERLFYNELLIEEGDEVEVTLLPQASNDTRCNFAKFTGILCAVTSQELFVLLENGTYRIVTIMDLRSGKSTLSLTPSMLPTPESSEDES